MPRAAALRRGVQLRRCAREGTPRPESSAVRAHVPAAFWFFADAWDDLFRNGIVDHALKSAAPCTERWFGLHEGQYDDLLNFEASPSFDDRQKAALAYAEAIAWRLETDDAFWERMSAHFSQPELVELGCMIGLTFGQQSWLRMLNIDHHQVLPGSDASMAPGFETPQALEASKRSDDYWARR